MTVLDIAVPAAVPSSEYKEMPLIEGGPQGRLMWALYICLFPETYYKGGTATGTARNGFV